MSNKVLMLLADGFEEVEAVTPIDYLCRAGADVTIAAIGDSLTVKGARAGVRVLADTTLAQLAPKVCEYDAVVVPGGMPGAANLAACTRTASFLKAMNDAGKLVCAICASPALVLAPLGLLAGKKFTCYPGMEEKIQWHHAEEGQHLEDRVVTDGNIITSRAAGTSGEFAIAIIKALFDEETSKKIAEAVLL